MIAVGGEMADLTERELRFLYTQRIDESAVMDCSWMRSHGYKWHMNQEGFRSSIMNLITPEPFGVRALSHFLRQLG